MMSNVEDYQRQIESQIAQYADVVEMHDSSEAADWLNQTYLGPRLEHVFGSANPAEIYARAFSEAIARTGVTEVVSLGAGYGALEIAIVKLAKKLNLPNFRIICLELSPLLVERIRASARAEGVEDSITAQEADLNKPLKLPKVVAAFMAHHALHHFVELELLFDQIAAYMHPEGAFVTMDMIGRNGHMRWPETLKVVRDIWPTLPDRVKWDRSFSKLDRWYENWDCSIEGFEGIRSQDILPELIDRFRFERFHANYSIADVFVDRRFGGGFLLKNQEDMEFLKRVQKLEDDLIRDNRVKPAQIFAVMRSLNSTTCPARPICFGGITPEKALRPIDENVTISRSILADYAFETPYRNIPAAPPLVKVAREQPLSFGRKTQGVSLTRWGWCEPDDTHVWSTGLDSALEFEAADGITALSLRLHHHVPTAFAGQVVQVLVNGTPVMDIKHFDRETYECTLLSPILAGKRVLIEFSNSRPRRPDIDGGPDNRPLGFALFSLVLK